MPLLAELNARIVTDRKVPYITSPQQNQWVILYKYQIYMLNIVHFWMDRRSKPTTSEVERAHSLFSLSMASNTVTDEARDDKIVEGSPYNFKRRGCHRCEGALNINALDIPKACDARRLHCL